MADNLTEKFEQQERGEEKTSSMHSDDPKVLEKLREENKALLPVDLKNKKIFEDIIDKKNIKELKDINFYLKKVKNFKLVEDFFIPHTIGKPSMAEECFLNPDLTKIRKGEEYIKKNEERIQKWEKVIGKKFTGKKLADLLEFVGEHYETRIVSQTAPPRKDLANSKGEKGKDNFRWTQKETEKNLQWKKQCLSNSVNPMQFLDWLDENLENKEKQRDKQLIEWAEKNIKTAQKNPQFFSKKYLQLLEEIKNDLKAGKPNHFPVELLEDFDKHALKDEHKKRLNFEKEISKQIDKHSKLIGPKNVMEWKAGWIKEAPIEELIEWFKGKGGIKTKFEQEITKLQKQREQFTRDLDKYPASEENKKEYLDWYDTLNSEDKEKGFEYLTGKYEKVLKTQEKAVKLKTKKSDYLTEEENEKLDKMSDYTRTEQEKIIEKIQRKVEEREAIHVRAKLRKKNFDLQIKDYEEGTSDKELEDILSPLLGFKQEIEKFKQCPALLGVLHDYEEIQTEYGLEYGQKDQSHEQDFMKEFLADPATIIFALDAMNRKLERDESHKSEEVIDEERVEKASASDDIVDKKAQKEAVKEHAENEARRVDANISERDVRTQVNIAEAEFVSNSSYMKENIEEKTFKKTYNEILDRNAKESLKDNNTIRYMTNSINSGHNNIISLSKVIDGTRKITRDNAKSMWGNTIGGKNKTVFTNSAGREIKKDDVSWKRQKKSLFMNFVEKLGRGKSEAKKLEEIDSTKFDNIIKLRASKNLTGKESLTEAKRKTGKIIEDGLGLDKAA